MDLCVILSGAAIGSTKKYRGDKRQMRLSGVFGGALPSD